MLYLDSSALVKLVVTEAETSDLRAWLAGHVDRGRVTSTLACVEVVRAVRPYGAAAVDTARRLLATLGQIELTKDVLDEAALAGPDQLRTLDAIHLACARQLGTTLAWLVAYDQRLLAAATAAGLATASPPGLTGPDLGDSPAGGSGC